MTAFVRSRPHPVRRFPGLGLAVVAVFAVLAFGVVPSPWSLPSLPNPLAKDGVDRTGPAVLHALSDLSEFHAATGTFQVVVDVERDARYVPSALMGERTVFLATGTVDAVVDLRDLGEQRVVVSDDGRSVEINLPRARLDDPRIDPAASRVVSRDRGLLDRVGSALTDSPSDDRELYLRAEAELRRAASADARLVETAEVNTTKMLKALLSPLGVDEVAVRYGP